MNATLTTARKRLDDAWHSFVVDKRVPPSIRPEILRSWQRACAESRVDPGLRRCLEAVGAQDLLLRTKSEEALRVASSLLEEFAERLAPDGHALIYCGADGLTMTMGGNRRTRDRLAEINLAPGAYWSEASTGTNGIGTALVEGRPVEVFAAEHFVAAWQPWSCAAVPVRAGGRIVGVVDITSPWEARHPSLLVCAEALARAIEGRLETVTAQREELIRRALSEKGTSGWLALDLDGRAVGIGPAAGLRRGDAAGRGLGLEAVIARLGMREGEFEHVVELDGRPMRVVCNPVAQGGRSIGVVLRKAQTTAAHPRLAPRHRLYRFEDILGSAPELARQIALARAAASSRLPVLVLGESGTGKELFAQAIHSQSDRSQKPFVAINCGAIPQSLLEAELFGYEPGSFTGGSKEGHRGRFEDADGGTLFLDEVSELTPLAQTALLRVLEEHEVTRIGSSSPRRVDVRVIAASNKDLRSQVAAGAFRQDLYYRLNVVSVELPPLRDRKEDLPRLVDHYLTLAQVEARRVGLTFSWEASTALVAYAWPGNVRELKNVVERAVVVAAGPEILPSDLPREVCRGAAPAARDEPVGGASESAVAAEPSDLADLASRDPELAALARALEACSWNVVGAARSLGVSRRTMYRKLQKYGLARGGAIPRTPSPPHAS